MMSLGVSEKGATMGDNENLGDSDNQGGESSKSLPLASAGLGDSPHSYDDDPDEELARMKQEMQELLNEEKRLKKATELDSMRRRLEAQRQKVSNLRGMINVEPLSKAKMDRVEKPKSQRSRSDFREIQSQSENDCDAEINLDLLRNDKDLMRKVRKELKKQSLLSDSESCSSDNSYLDDYSSNYTSSDESKNKKNKKKKHKKKKSGISAQASDRVRYPQRWPHSHLQFEHVNKQVRFDELDFKLFVAGELEIISDSELTSSERTGRLNLLKKIVYYYSTYEFKGLKAFYAAWLREIELGKKKWSDDSQIIESAILSKYILKTSKSRSSAARKTENEQNNDNVWFCQLYQRNKCLHKANHTETIKGKLRLAQHICATCWLKDRKKLVHPECSSSCPHAAS